MQNTKKLEIFNMSQERVLEIASTAPGKKLLPALAAAYLAEETTRDAKAAASKPAPPRQPTPNIDRAVAAARTRPAAPPNPLADVAEHILRQRASHRSAPPDQAKAAIIELARRGVIYSNGIFSQSHRSA